MTIEAPAQPSWPDGSPDLVDRLVADLALGLIGSVAFVVAASFIGSTYADVRGGRVLLDPQGVIVEPDVVVSLNRSGGFDA